MITLIAGTVDLLGEELKAMPCMIELDSKKEMLQYFYVLDKLGYQFSTNDKYTKYDGDFLNVVQKEPVCGEYITGHLDRKEYVISKQIEGNPIFNYPIVSWSSFVDKYKLMFGEKDEDCVWEF